MLLAWVHLGLQEQGPLLISADGGLMRNPYSWTKQANLLILESRPPKRNWLVLITLERPGKQLPYWVLVLSRPGLCEG